VILEQSTSEKLFLIDCLNYGEYTMLSFVQPVHVLNSWKDILTAYLITMRPYLMFISGITGIVGLSFIPHPDGRVILFVSIASFLAYGFGQALTDCFQIDTDVLSAPYRPLTQGKISRRFVLILSCSGLIFCLAAFASLNPVNLPIGIAAAVGLATYTPFKRKWWAGPLYNAWIVALLCFMAYLSGKTNQFPIPFVSTLLVVFFGYANFVLAGYFKDIEADRATGYKTFPVVFGRRIASAVSLILMMVTLGFAGLTIFMSLPVGGNPTAPVAAILFALTGSVTGIMGQVRLYLVRGDNDAHQAISCVVHTYVLLLASISCCNKPEWGIYLIMFYMLFNIFIYKRPSETQI
jgi:4-hydroxybenzoate polyprenyltransferase